MTDLDKVLRILIVENNPADRHLLTELLRTSIIKVQLPDTAETLEKAIELLRSARFDIILLDLSLPDSVGIDTLKSIKDFAGDTPVIILSGINDINMVTEAIRLGAQDYHVKEEMNEKLLTRTILYSIERNEFLRTTRQNYASLVNTIDGIVWEADAHSFTFTFVSERAERLLGYPVSKWIGEPNFWANHIYPHDRDAAVNYCLECTRQMIPHEFEYRMIAADGRIVWLKDIVTVIVENSQPVQLRGIMIDITKQKMIESALESSEKNLRQVLSSTADSFYVIDRECHIILINECAEKNLKKAWGTPVNVGTNILSVIPHEEDEPIRKSLEKVFAGEKVEYELHLTINGLPEWLLVNYMPVIDENGIVIGAYIRSKDISEQKRIEAGLKRSIERFEMIAATTHDAIWEWNLETGEIWGNAVHQRMYGLTVSDPAPGEEMWEQRIHPDDREAILADLEKTLASDKDAWISEYRFLTSQGYRNIYDRSYIVRDENQKPVRIMGSMMDITERTMAEEYLKNSQKQLLASIENTPNVAVQWYNRKGEVVFWNRASKLIFGWSSSEAMGKTLDKLIQTPEEMTEFLKTIDFIERTGETIGPVEFSFHRKDGTKGICLSTLFSIHTLSGEPCFVCMDVDITERKKAEELVKESEERYKALVENAPEALVVFDIEQRKFINVSRSAEKLFKMSREELLQIGPIDISPEFQPDGRLSSEAAIEKMNAAAAGEKPFFEWTHCDKEGNTIPCEVWLVRLPSDNRILIRGSVVDVSVRKKAELVIKQSEERYRSLIEQASDFIMITDQQGNFIDANSSFYRTFGFTKDELLQSNIRDVLDREQVESSPIRFDLLAKGETILRERKMIDKAGNIIEVEANVKMLPDGRILAIARDIRERKKAEQSIKDSEEKYRNLIEQASDPIITYSLDGRIISCNNAFVTSLGYGKNDIGNLRVNDLLFEEDLKANPLRFELIKKGMVVHDQRRVRRKDGSEMPVELNSKLMPGGDVMVIARDITERKKAEKLLLKEKDFSDSVINNLPGIFVMLDEEGNFLRWNKNFETISGYSTEEIPALSPTSLVDSDQVDFAVKKLQEGFALGETSAEIKLLTRNKEKIPYYFNGWRVFIEDKPCLIGIGYDLTERKKADFLVRASEEKYRTLVEQAVDAIALYDESGKILDVNTGSVNLLGYSKGELIQMNLSDVLTEEEIKVKPVRYDILQKGGSTVRQRLMKKKDGSVVQTEVRSQQLPDGRFLSVIRDLTERITAQEQIEREKELSDSIINSLPGLFYLIDEKARYVRWNKLKEQISGYNTEEIRSMTALDFFEGEEKELIRRKIKDGFTKGTTGVEAHFVTKSGKKILFYFTGIAIEYEGQKCLMGTGIDISDRKEAELELESSYKAIRQLTEHLQNIREEERTHIAREIHDELGQKLTVLKMDISWINKKLTEKDEVVKARLKELLTMLDDTVKSVRRISSELRPSLLDDLGLTAAMEWHLNEFQKRFDIRTHFKSVDELLLPEAMKTGLFRIFQESLTNVARHASAKKVSVSLERENGSVVLCVTDDGVGFDKQNAAAKKTLGILGMKERTSMIGGTYEIISKPGKGTKVVVTIPLKNKTSRL